MTESTFDALAAARELEAAGFERGQAEAVATQLRTVAGAGHDALATKPGIAVLRADLYRALWVQGGAIVVILTTLRFLPI